VNWFDSVIAWLFPNVLVEGTPWNQLWVEKERNTFLLGCWLFFPLVAIAYVAHYFFYDKPNDLQPLEFWLAFRLVIASGAVATLFLYATVAARWGAYRLPAIVMCWVMCQSQAYVALWHGLESWVFCYILILASVLMLRMSAVKSIIFVACTIATQAPVLIQAGIQSSYIFTGSVVTLAITLVIRSANLSEVRSFLLYQENIAAQKRIIELNLEFSERIRSFIPRVIAQRIDDCMEGMRMSVIEASIEVLSPKTKLVGCLFSDIRGYTQQSKELQAFIRDSVIPEVKACTDAIEDLRGIPRKVGDLIFAYFDDDDSEQNLLACVLAGMTVSRLNQDRNATANSKIIKRYVLISYGEALVGNLGGLDSSIEITALGSPVNFLSRVDELTKKIEISRTLRPGDLVLSEPAARLLRQLAPAVKQTQIDLFDLGLTIRDFAEVRYIFSVSPDDSNHGWLVSALDEHKSKSHEQRCTGSVAA
jgi:class 3 adenylate cyclase